jgi:cytochrome c-type biogenesis protein CcmH
LDPSLQDKVSPNDTLFVFARAASGPRMPLAIIRTSVSDLPLEFTLDDSQSMNPQMKISRFDKVVVGARISKSGQAMPQSGDLSGQTGVVSLGSEDLKITIDGVVP